MLLALNAGRLRSMGAPSAASLLPLRESNALVMDFGVSEILPARGDVPVFFGACCFDPRQPLDSLIDSIIDAGFQGVANFPTSIFLGGEFRASVEAAGVGFAREVELLSLARARGLLTVAYVGTPAEAQRMAEAEVDVVNLNLGWNKGGREGASPSLDLAEAGDYARRVFRKVRRLRPETLCTIEGGPIVSPVDMHGVCEAARADGYIGGSTIDRIPIETAIEDAAAGFKMIAELQSDRQAQEAYALRRKRNYGLIGWSDAIVQTRRDLHRLAASEGPVMVMGPSGSGKHLVARVIAAERKARGFTALPCDEWGEESLFGAPANVARPGASPRLGMLEGGRDQMVFVEDLGRLKASAQSRLVTALESGSFIRLGDSEERRVSCHLVLACADTAGVDGRILELLRARTIVLPPLKDRIEDLPLLARSFLASLDRKASIEPASYGTLMTHDWPGNVRELRAVVEAAAAAAGDQSIGPDHLLPLFGHTRRPPVHNEREWIVDALRRHKFRRAETAKFLGLSRKTLYNKMHSLGIARN